MTALVGQNGAGKTNVLRGIQKVAERCTNYPQKIDDKLVLLRTGGKEWLLEASWNGPLLNQQGKWAVRMGRQAQLSWLWRKAPVVDVSWLPSQDEWNLSEVWEDNSRSADTVFKFTRLKAGSVIKPFSQTMLKSAWSNRYFKTSGPLLQRPSYSEAIPPKLGEDCSDLAWMLAYLKGAQEEIFVEITDSLREVVRTFKRIRHRPALIKGLEKKEVVINNQKQLYDEESQVMGQELRFDMASGNDLSASAISEGTLLSLAILTAVIHEDTGNQMTILLDDIESGLHPSTQRDLIRQLKVLQEKRANLQIIFSSHSPYIIDEMTPEDVWLFAPDKEGIPHCAKLSEHPDAKRALGVLTTGEFWSAEGEAWVLDPSKRASEEPATAAK